MTKVSVYEKIVLAKEKGVTVRLTREEVIALGNDPYIMSMAGASSPEREAREQTYQAIKRLKEAREQTRQTIEELTKEREQARQTIKDLMDVRKRRG